MSEPGASPHRRTSIRRAASAAEKLLAGKRPQHNKYALGSVPSLLEKYGDPRAVLLEIATTPTATLARKLKCTELEAAQERRHAALAVLPYVASKMPVQVDMRHTRAIHITFEGEDDQGQPIEQLTHALAPVLDLTAEDITTPTEKSHANGSKAGRVG